MNCPSASWISACEARAFCGAASDSSALFRRRVRYPRFAQSLPPGGNRRAVGGGSGAHGVGDRYRSQSYIAAPTKVPVTAFIRIEAPRKGVVEGKFRARLELYAAYQATTLKIAENNVPLELEPTAALVYQLEGAPIWDFEIAGFRFADQAKIFGDGLVMMHPYRPGRIPVVFVHGTASSPVRWVEMAMDFLTMP